MTILLNRLATSKEHSYDSSRTSEKSVGVEVWGWEAELSPNEHILGAVYVSFNSQGNLRVSVILHVREEVQKGVGFPFRHVWF